MGMIFIQIFGTYPLWKNGVCIWRTYVSYIVWPSACLRTNTYSFSLQVKGQKSRKKFNVVYGNINAIWYNARDI